MLRSWLRWMWRHPRWTMFLLTLLGFVSVNIVAFNHAYAMTHFSTGGSRTGRPETLSAWQKAQVCLLGVNIPRPENRTTPESLELPFETRKFFSSDGTKLEAWYVPHPHARGVVLFVHGYANCKSQLLSEARALHERGYAAFLLDCRGSGGSSGNETTVGVNEADDVQAAVEDLKQLTPKLPLILYGRSMGSVAILRAIAVHGVQPQAAILECPFDKLVSTAGNRFAAMGLPSFPFAELVIFWGGVQHGFNGFRHNPVEYARQVGCPVLLLHGASDKRVTKEQAESVFESLPGEKKLEIFDAGHEAYLAVTPQEWDRAVSAFLAAHGGE